MQKKTELYSGKSKTIFSTDDPKFLVMQFRDDITAFNAEKKANLARKGLVNNYFNAFIMEKLSKAGIANHFVKVLSDTESLVKNLEMIKVECVVRNIAAGGICKRLGIASGTELKKPIFEFFYKSDALGDPIINDDHIRVFEWASDQEIATMKELTFKTNEILKKLFLDAGMLLVDYKLEFGRDGGQLVLADEFTPDGCRIWDKTTREILDKDRFRKDLGNVIESYEIAAKKLGIKISDKP